MHAGFRLILLSLAGLLTGGCIPIQKYRDLETSLAESQSELTDREERIHELEGDLGVLEARVEELERQKKLLEEALADKRVELDEALGRQAELIADRGKLAEDVEAMKQALAELEARKAAAEARVQDYKQLLSRFQKLIDAGKLEVKIVDGRMVVELATDVLFDSGAADLSEEGSVSIREVSSVLASIQGRSYQVEGHTDDVPISTSQYPSNWELAAARALTVVKTMIDAGMPPGRISAASYAEYKPVAPNETEQGRAANRRIEIVVMPDLSNLPGYDELQKVSGAAGSGKPPAPRRPRRRKR